MMEQSKGRDLFSVKDKTFLNRMKDIGTKRKKRKRDISQSKGKRRKLDENTKEIEDIIEYIPLSYSNASVGQVVLGCILKVFKHEIIVSLPNRMQGHLSILDISKSYNDLLNKISNRDASNTSFYNLEDLYAIGHLIITKIKSVVLHTDGTSKIQLSILPEDVNKELTTWDICQNSIVQSAVVAEEENGYVMDAGIRNLRAAFLPKEKAPEGTVGVGSVFLCAVKKIFSNKDKRDEMSISLTTELSFLNNPFPVSEDLSIRSIVPGTLVSTKIKKVTKEGFEILIDNFNGFVSIHHLESHTERKKIYKAGKHFMARVLYVNEFTNVIYCSFNLDICSESVFERNLSKFSIGDICDATVLNKNKEEVHFSLPNGCWGLLAANKLKVPTKGFMKKMEIGLSVSCRVRHIHLIDQIHMLSVESKQSLERGNLFAGKVVTVKIAEHNENGALGLVVGYGVVGFIPDIHFPESDQSLPEDICRIGQKYEARILKYASDKGLELTLKSDLVSCELPLVTEFSESAVGVITMGCIVKIYERGFLAQFFGGAKGFIPKYQIPQRMQDDYQKYFHVGMTIKCRILYCNAEDQKLTASLFLSPADKKLDVSKSRADEKKLDVSEVSADEKKLDVSEVSADKNKKFDVSKVRADKNKPGLVIKRCKVSLLENDEVHVNISELNISASIPLCHLSDDNDLSRTIFSLLKVGDEIGNAVVFSQSPAGLILSLKRSINQHLRNSSKKKEQIKCGSVYPSVIDTVFDDKIIVIPSGSVSTKHHIEKCNIFEGEDINSLLNVGIQKGQSLILKCVQSDKKDAKEPKLVAYLKSVMSNPRTSGLQILYDILVTENQIKKSLNERTEINLGQIKIGSSYTGKVLCINKAGALVRISELNLDGVIHPYHYSTSKAPQLNKELQIRVLNINYKENCLELTAKQEIKDFFNGDHSIVSGQECSCEILVAKKDYIIGRLTSALEGQIVYLPSRRHINDMKGRHSYYELGRKYDIVIEYVNDRFILANLKVHTNVELLELEEESLCFDFKGLVSSGSLENAFLDESSLTKHDFQNKAKKKIENITRATKIMEKLEKGIHAAKWDKLQDDKFSPVDELIYWELISQQRQERNKLRKQKFGPIKVQKANIGEGTNILNSNSIVQKIDTCKNTRSEKLKGKEKINNKQKKKKRVEALEEEEEENDVESPTKRIKVESEEIKASKSLKKKESKKEEKEEKSKNMKSKAFLVVKSSGFDWSEPICSQKNLEEESSSEEEQEEDEVKDKEQKSVNRLDKHVKLTKLKAAEEKTRELELERLDVDREPETAFEYEEKINRNPRSSDVWIEYIGFHLQNAETEKARAVAERSLTEFPVTMTTERLKLWNVVLRLEVMFGTADSVQKAFSEAVVLNDELKIYYLMIDIYINANKIKEANELIKKMVKKYSQEKEVWIQAFTYSFRANKVKEAREMLDKSLLSLHKKDQIEVINRFAQLELKYGDMERGKTIFEKLLSNFPKRLDIWNVYADLLLKQNDIEGTRNVLERITGLKLKMKAMRSAFKKLMEFEKEHGTNLSVENVKKRVEEYVASALKEEE